MTGHCEVLVRRQTEVPKPPDSATRRSWLPPAGRSVRVPRPDVAPRGTSDHSPVTADPVTEARKTLQNCSPGWNRPPLRPSHQRVRPICRRKYIPPSFAIQVPVRLESSGPGAPPDDSSLTGTWMANDGGMYFLRQIGRTLWWLGLSGGLFHPGLQFCNVFRASVTGSAVTGEWSDVPRGATSGRGTLTLRPAGGNQLLRVAESGGFGTSVWRR